MLERIGPEVPAGGPDGPVAVVERRVAGLLGKEAGLLFPTGKMAQQVALRVHAERRGRWTFAAHPHCHLVEWEAQGFSVVHGLRFAAVADRHELISLADLERVAEPLAAVLWELPQRDLGGLLPTWDELVAQTGLARSRGAAAHMDGARLWEAQTYYDRPLADVAGLFDSVYVSLYKGLQGVAGSVLAGDADFVAHAAVWRLRLGGEIHAAWPLAASALYGLDELLPRMPEFRDHAVALAAAINADGVAFTVPGVPLTPLFHVVLPASRAAVERAGAALAAEEGVQLFGAVRSSPDPGRCSFEVSVGESAVEFSPAELVGFIRGLLKRAGGS
ncbi:threonine aldolase [Actinokineospora sp. NBRC 105648]|nr:threonine aldolase [Actinokineospora sp. NBRC 105648]